MASTLQYQMNGRGTISEMGTFFQNTPSGGGEGVKIIKAVTFYKILYNFRCFIFERNELGIVNLIYGHLCAESYGF